MSNPAKQVPNEHEWRRRRAIWVGWKLAKHAEQAILRSTGEQLSEKAVEILAGCFKASLLRPIPARPPMRVTAAKKRATRKDAA